MALLLFRPCAAGAQTLAWDPSPSEEVTGYRVYQGPESGSYTSQVDVGNVTTYQPVGVDWSKPQFFSVQAYTASGLTSVLTPAAEWVPSITKLTSLTSNAGNPLLIGRTVTWTVIGSNNFGPVHYQFWLFGRNGWTNVQSYGPSNTYSWTPGWDDQGVHYLQVWARGANSTASSEAFLGTDAFSVNSEPMTITSDSDFPTPPGNPITWTATVSGAGTTPLEYKFWVLDQTTGWTAFRDWNVSNQAVWTPSATGTYAVQAWARKVGNAVNYDTWVGADKLTVSRTPPSITALTVDRPFPSRTGTPLTWTARSRGGSAGPVEYQFWLYSTQTGWTIAQPYGSSKTFTWTPGWADAGTHALQVWVRSAGSTPPAGWEGWKGTEFFTIERSPLHLGTTTLFPVAPGTPVQWTASSNDLNVSLQYKFWVYSLNTASWSVGQDYGPSNTFIWTPTTGTYAIQAWARQVGSANAYDAWRGTEMLTVAASPASVLSLTSSVPLPVSSGTQITWTAGATGGTGPLQYQFWRLDPTTGWSIAQPYGSSKTYTWTPSAGDVGIHAVQVWVRSPGSTSTFGYDSYLSSGLFNIQP